MTRLSRSGCALVGGDDEAAVGAGEVGQRGHDRHRHRRQSRRRRDEERQRQEEEVHDDGERGLADVAERLLGPVQDGVGDLAVVHDDGDAAGDADDEGDTEEVAGAVDERGGELALVHPVDQADEDGEEEERGRHLGEPPPQGGEADAQVLPRDDPVDHHREGGAEESEDELVLAGEDDLTGVGVGRCGEVAFVVLLHVEHERRGRVVPHPLGVAEHEPDAGGQADDEDDESESEAVAEGDVGEAGGDAGGERVDGRAEHADAAAEQDDQRPDERVVTGGDHHGDDEDVEGEALLGHPERRSADGEDGHQDRDHPAFVTAKAGHEQRDAGLDGARLHRDADEAADDEDEQGDVDGAEQVTTVEHVDVAGGRVLDAVEAVDRRLQRVDDDPRRGRVDLLVRARDR